MFVLEAEVLEFGLDLVQAQAVGQRGVNVHRFAGYLVLLAGEHGAKGAHVVEAVGNLDKDDADVVAHGEQQLLEVFGLCGSLVAEDTARYLGQSVHNLGYLGAEDVLDVLDGVVGVFHHVVQQGGADGGGTQSDFSTHNLGYGDGVQYVRFTRTPLDAFVRLVGKVECLGDDFHTLAVLGGQVAVQQVLESCLYHRFFRFLFLFQIKVLFHIRIQFSSLSAKISKF